MTGLELRHWARSWNFTHSDAAEALGIGRSSFCKYLLMQKIPEVVRLASIGHDSEKAVVIDDKYKLLKRRYERIESIIKEAQS